MKCSILAVFFAYLDWVLSITGDYGPYRMKMERITASSDESIASTKVRLAVTKHAKLMEGNLTAHRKLGPIGLMVHPATYSGGVWIPGAPHNFQTICEDATLENAKLFLENFPNMKLHEKTCTINKGSYKMNKCSLEPNMKRVTGENYVYGRRQLALMWHEGDPEKPFMVMNMTCDIVNSQLDENSKKVSGKKKN